MRARQDFSVSALLARSIERFCPSGGFDRHIELLRGRVTLWPPRGVAVRAGDQLVDDPGSPRFVDGDRVVRGVDLLRVSDGRSCEKLGYVEGLSPGGWATIGGARLREVLDIVRQVS